jgi:hypothetical protein
VLVSGAPLEARSAFWKKVGEIAGNALGQDAPTWMSTHGGGVPWLHMRFDPAPKYYHHEAFKRRPAEL